MYIVLSNYAVCGLYRRVAAANRLTADIKRVESFAMWPELAPRIVRGDGYDDFADLGLHYKELDSITFWIDRSRPVWGRVVLREG